MTAATAPQLEWQLAAAAPLPGLGPEPRHHAASLAASNPLELVLELAHDLRSPLTSILLLADALRRGLSGPVGGIQRHQLELIYGAALSLCATATDVLDVVSNGKPLLDREPAPFAVAELLTSVRDTILPLAEVKGLKLRLLYSRPEWRLGHEPALSRVLLNLATNAVKFTDRGFVELAARPLGAKHLQFSVRDTGHGLDPTGQCPQQFREAPSGLRHCLSSSGLGLVICRKLVRAMGSELQVETPRGGGARFFFALQLPRCAAPAGRDQVPEPHSDGTPRHAPLPKLRVPA